MGKTFVNRAKRTCKQNDFRSQMQDLQPTLRSMMVKKESYLDLIAEVSALTIDFNITFPNEFGESEGQCRLRCYDNFKSVKQSIEQLLSSDKPLTSEFKKFEWIMMAMQIEIIDHKLLFVCYTEQELHDVLTTLSNLCINRMYEITQASGITPVSQPVSPTQENNTIMNAQTNTTSATSDETIAAVTPVTTAPVNNETTQKEEPTVTIKESISAGSKATVEVAEEVLKVAKDKTEKVVEAAQEKVKETSEKVKEKVKEAAASAKEKEADKEAMSTTAKVLLGVACSLAGGLAAFYGYKFAKSKGLVGVVADTVDTAFDTPVVGG